MRQAFTDVEARHRLHLRVLPPRWKLACHAGCHHCCAQQVSVTALEVFEIAAFLRRTLAADALAAVKTHVRAVAEAVRGRSAAEHRGTQCPLLADGRCSIYEVRPLLCRGANSFDAAACAKVGAAIPTYTAIWDAAQTVQQQLDDEAERISGRSEILELSGGLRIALELPDAEARWHRGEPIFQAAAHAWFERGALHHWRR